MKTGKHILALVFALLGGTYLLIGLIMGMVDRTSFAADHSLFITSRIFAALGVLFLAFTLMLFWRIRILRRRQQELLAWGTRVTATVVDVRTNYSVKINRRCPSVIHAQCIHPVTREPVTLRSHNVWNCPITPGQSIDIAFDPYHEKRYVFDIPQEVRP